DEEVLGPPQHLVARRLGRQAHEQPAMACGAAEVIRDIERRLGLPLAHRRLDEDERGSIEVAPEGAEDFVQWPRTRHAEQIREWALRSRPPPRPPYAFERLARALEGHDSVG